jgi:hypothetical protein
MVHHILKHYEPLQYLPPYPETQTNIIQEIPRDHIGFDRVLKNAVSNRVGVKSCCMN